MQRDLPGFWLRAATEADAGEVARIAEATFRQAFGSANSVRDTAMHCAKNFGHALQLAEIQDPRVLTIVVEATPGLVGYGQLRAGHAPECIKARSAREIHRFYVDHGWHGKGVAQALMARLLQSARAEGSDCVWLGVWERNPRAIAFYQKAGFAVVGEHAFKLGDDTQRDVIMSRDI